MSLNQQRSFNPGALEGPARNPGAAPQPAYAVRRSSSRRHLFLDLPIVWRLTLGFVVAALVAGLASGTVGIQRAQSLSKQTDFYHNLLQFNTSLTTGRSFLELMSSKLHQTLDDANAPHQSRETVAADIAALNNLTNLYAQTLNNYAQNNLLDQHPDQLALLDEAGDSGLAAQQRTLTSSAQRTWQFYRDAQQQILRSVASNDVPNAQLVLQQQGEPTNADALSALHSLIQFNDRVASAVDAATNVEIHSQLLTTLLATLGAFLAIALVGWFLSDTLVRRLHDLHRVTHAVEEGRINERVLVVGRDEIADVSIAVNAMVDTIVGLLEETRQQRDALSGAAEHLFSDMRIVNGGDLRVSATVRNNDPIGVLANAFNFTVGRFRRFVLRTSTTIEQLDVVSRQGLERSNAFTSLVRAQFRDVSTFRPPSAPTAFTNSMQQSATGPLKSGGIRKPFLQADVAPHEALSFTQQVQQAQDVLVPATRDDLNKRLNATRETVETASLSIGRLSELIASRSGSHSGNVTEKMVQAQLQELASLEKVLNKLAWEVRQTQFSAITNLTGIDAAFAHIARSASSQQEVSAPVAAEPSSYLADPQFQEFARQAGSFAVEVNVLSKRLAAIIQEMRSSITPFRLEGATSMSELTRTAASLASTEQPASRVSSGNLVSNWQ